MFELILAATLFNDVKIDRTIVRELMM